MYLLFVSANSAADWVNRVQNQLNHILTQGSKLDESGDWDQQAIWKDRGGPLWVRDEKYGVDACQLKEEESIPKGKAAVRQASPENPKLTGDKAAPQKKNTASKPQAAKLVTGEDTDENDADEGEESEEGGGATASLRMQDSKDSPSETG